MLEKKNFIEAEIAYLKDEIAQAKKEHNALEGQADRVATDVDIELYAKRSLHFQRPGETVFVFYEKTENSATGEMQEQQIEFTSPQPNPLKWWNYFFSKHHQKT